MNKLSPTNQRIRWIDIAKGNAIILMVLGHSSLPEMIQSWIFAFHMPLFFILSGLTTNWTKDSFLIFFHKKLIGLGVPFIIYSVLCILVIYASDLADLSWSSGWGDFALWFVPVLFLALLVSKLVLSSGARMKWIFIITLPIISGLLRQINLCLPWNISVVPYASFFIITGYYAKGYISKLFGGGRWWWMILTFTVTLYISRFYHLDMSRNQCLPLIPLTLAAISGTIFMTSVSYLMDKHVGWLSGIIQSIGKETFSILAFSQIIIMILNKYFLLNAIFKYCILITALICIKYLKDAVVHLYKTELTTHKE